MFASSFHWITVYSHSSLWNSLHSLNPSEIFLGSASLCNGWSDSLNYTENKYWYKMSGTANYINNHNNTCFLLIGQLSYVVLWYDWPVQLILINPACNLDLQLLQAMTSWSQGVEAQWKSLGHNSDSSVIFNAFYQDWTPYQSERCRRLPDNQMSS